MELKKLCKEKDGVKKLCKEKDGVKKNCVRRRMELKKKDMAT